jgi:hypothetical protein
MPAHWMKNRLILSAILLAALSIGLADVASAIPAFSRKYKTSCSTCHYAFPQLNAFGKAFRNNGYRYPGGDENYRKEEPVSLGSEAYKRVFPNAIWPSDIPGSVPLAVHVFGQFEAAFNQPDSVAKTEFAFPQGLHLLYAGTLGQSFSAFGEVEVEEEDGDVEVGFPFRLEMNHRTTLNAAIGNLGIDPTGGDHNLIPGGNNISGLTSRNGWALEGEHPGFELWGASNGPRGKGGWKYVAGVVDGQGGDVGRREDVFGRATYKFGGLGEVGGTEGQASQTSAFYVDNNVTVGGYIYSGRVGADLYADREDITAWGGTLDAWYGRFILDGTVLGLDSTIPDQPNRSSLAWYLQGQYVIYPWLIGLARYESTHLDRADGSDAETTLLPTLVAMLRANIKLSLAYRRPLNDYDARKTEEEHLVARVDLGI